MSMHSRRSQDFGNDHRPSNHRRSNSWSLRSPINGGPKKFGSVGDRQHVMHSYDVDANGLEELTEDSDEERKLENANANGTRRPSGEGSATPQRERGVGMNGHKSFER